MTIHEKNRLDLMADEIENLKEEVSEMKLLLKDIHTLLAGNPLDSEKKGLLSDHRHVKSDLYLLRAEIKKYKAYVYALITLVGFGILNFLKQLLIK